MFIPGETIVHEFIIPFIASDLSKVILTYKQNDRIILTKTISSFEDVGAGKTKVTFAFSQKESLLFDNDANYKIQLNVYTDSGTRASSVELESFTGIQHYEKVIGNG